MSASSGPGDSPATGVPLYVAGARLRALVVGGGTVAARKLAALLDGGAAHVRVIAPAIGAAVRDSAATAGVGRVTLVEREYRDDDVADANLVVAATNVRAVNARVAHDADRAGRLASVADAPDEGAWTSMATHRTGPLVVAVAAGGVPTAAARVRDAVAVRFDGRYAGPLARLARLRDRLIDRGDGEQWRAAAEELTGADFCDAVERGDLGPRLSAWEERTAWA